MNVGELQRDLKSVFEKHGVSVGVGLNKGGVSIRSQDARVDAGNIRVAVLPKAGTRDTYRKEPTRVQPPPIPEPARPVAEGDRFQRGDEHGPVFVVVRVEKRDGVSEQAVIKREGSVSSSRGRVPVESLRYGDGGWRRL